MTGKEQQYSKMHYQFFIFSFLFFPFCSQLWILMNTLKFQKTQSVGWLVLPVSIFTLLSTLICDVDPLRRFPFFVVTLFDSE